MVSQASPPPHPAIACQIAGLGDEAAALLSWTRSLRHADGDYWTGLHIPTRTYFPEGERTAYSAAAVVIAHAVLDPGSPTARLFMRHFGEASTIGEA